MFYKSGHFNRCIKSQGSLMTHSLLNVTDLSANIMQVLVYSPLINKNKMRPQQRYKTILVFEIIVWFHYQFWNNISKEKKDEQFLDRLIDLWMTAGDTTAKGQIILTSIYIFTENKITI